ncbi:MAG: hypothetical protein ACO1NW_00840 [Chitinophagaceae bacterium]
MLKNILLATALILGKISFAQCDKPILLKFSKGIEIKNGNPGQEMPFECSLEIADGKVVLTATMEGKTESVEGNITEIVRCDWKAFLKNGITQYKASMKKGEERMENATIEIKSENNYTLVTLASDPDTGSKLQLVVKEYTILEVPDTGTEQREPIAENKEKKRNHKKKQKS